MNLKQLPKHSLPREKLLSHGAETLTDAELLAIFLRTGVSGCNVLQLADQVLRHFGSLRGLFSASHEQFCSVKGLGDAKFVQLQAIREMTQRHLTETLKREEVFTSPDVTKLFLMNLLKGRHREVFIVLFLDTQHRLITSEILFEGTLNCASIYAREILERVIFHHAAAVIFAHNHPSGVAEPSQSDRSLTHRLQKALDLIEVRTLDHFVVGDGEITSFAERGWII